MHWREKDKGNMYNDEVEIMLNNLIDEYYRIGKFSEIYGNRNRTEEEWINYRKKLKIFINDHMLQKELYEKFLNSGVGETFYLSTGYGIFENLE